MLEKTFMNITNKDIYEKLMDIEKHVMNTNGKVKLNKWIATTSLMIGLMMVGWCISLLI